MTKLQKAKQLLGQRVTVEHKGVIWGGVLDFVGYNPLHGEMQVTISRAPLWPIKLSTIKKMDIVEWTNRKN